MQFPISEIIIECRQHDIMATIYYQAWWIWNQNHKRSDHLSCWPVFTV